MNVVMVPIALVRVLNPRARSRAKFREIVGNIERLGMKRPITVSPRTDGEPGYDLVCGQGRLEACRGLGHTEVPAIVRDLTIEDRYLMSLVENMARRPLQAVELARQLAALRERGLTSVEIAARVDLSESYVRELLVLVDHGEERLIAAVERGDMPISIAAQIALADDASVQRALAAAYDAGTLRGKALAKVRRLMEQRRQSGPAAGKPGTTRKSAAAVSAGSLVRAYQRESERQRALVEKARACDERLLMITSALRKLLADGAFVAVPRAQKIDTLPAFLAEGTKRP